jgi:crossover junction endodeoxyribonuclease RusA
MQIVLLLSMNNAKKINIILPFPKFTANNRNIYAKGRIFNSPKYKAYQQECYLLTRGIIDKSLMPIKSVVHTTINIYPPDNRRRDDDNYVKPIKDVLTFCGVWMDDHWSKKTVSEMHEKSDKPRIEIEIRIQ